jgi:hypothetical protein
MSIGTTLDAGVYFRPYQMSADILSSVVSFLDLWPEVYSEIVEIHLKRQFVGSLALQTCCEVLFVLLLAQANLSLIFVLKLFFIRVVDFLVNHLLDILYLGFTSLSIQLSVVVFYHHHTTLLIVPGYFRLLTYNLLVLVTYEKWFGEGSIQHHYQCPYREEAWEVSLL